MLQNSEGSKLLATLKEICTKYGIEPELCLNIRVRHHNNQVDAYDFETDPTKFGSNELGFVVILKIPKSAWAHLSEVQDQIFKSIPRVARILIEID